MNLKSNECLSFPFFNEDECKDIINYTRKKRTELRNVESSGWETTYTSNQITTANYYRYNFFKDNPQYINRLLKCFKDKLPWLEYPLSLQSWVNLYEMNEGIGWHNHFGLDQHSYTANIFIGGPTKPGVYYTEPGSGEILIENTIGTMILSNCSLFHTAPPNKEKKPRYTVGLTIHDYQALTKDLLKDCCFNSTHKGIILVSEYNGN